MTSHKPLDVITAMTQSREAGSNDLIVQAVVTAGERGDAHQFRLHDTVYTRQETEDGELNRIKYEAKSEVIDAIAKVIGLEFDPVELNGHKTERLASEIRNLRRKAKTLDSYSASGLNFDRLRKAMFECLPGLEKAVTESHKSVYIDKLIDGLNYVTKKMNDAAETKKSEHVGFTIPANSGLPVAFAFGAGGGGVSAGCGGASHVGFAVGGNGSSGALFSGERVSITNSRYTQLTDQADAWTACFDAMRQSFVEYDELLPDADDLSVLDKVTHAIRCLATYGRSHFRAVIDNAKPFTDSTKETGAKESDA